MIQRTISGKVIKKGEVVAARPELKRWEARDEWGQPVVSDGEPTDEFPKWKVIKAIDATAAAELFVAHLVNRYDCEGPTIVQVRPLPDGPWVGVQVDVEFTIGVEISARGMAPVRKPQKPRRAKASWERDE